MAVFFTSLTCGPLDAAQLQDIRVGSYENFTRIVFEFDQPFQFSTPISNNYGKILVPLHDTYSSFQPAEVLQQIGQISRIEFKEDDSNILSTEITVEDAEFRLIHFTLSKPERLVLDIYWQNTTHGSVLPITKTKGSNSQRVLIAGPIKIKAPGIAFPGVEKKASESEEWTQNLSNPQPKEERRKTESFPGYINQLEPVTTKHQPADLMLNIEISLPESNPDITLSAAPSYPQSTNRSFEKTYEDFRKFHRRTLSKVLYKLEQTRTNLKLHQLICWRQPQHHSL